VGQFGKGFGNDVSVVFRYPYQNSCDLNIATLCFFFLKILLRVGGDGEGETLSFEQCHQKDDESWVVVSNIFYFHPYLGKIPILTNIFQLG